MENQRDRMRTSEFRDILGERKIIAGMLKHEEIMRRCLETLSSEIFSSDKHKWIYEEIVFFYEENSVAINEKSFEIVLDKKPLKERKTLLKIWKLIEKNKKVIKFPTCLALINRLNKLHKARLIELGISETLDHLTRATEGGEEYINRAIESFTVISDRLETKQTAITITDPISLYSTFKKKHLEIQKDPGKFLGIQTGIEKLDDTMGGLRPGEIGLITAATGVGKSILLLDFAFNCYIKFGNVLYVTIEMPESQLRERFYCRLSKIKYENFRMFTLNQDHWKILDKKIKRLMDENKNKFFIMDIPQSSTIKGLKNEVESFIKKNGVPKLILVDYLNIMAGGFEWTKQLELAVGVKQQIARYFKVATWTANQLAGSKHDTEHVRVSDFGYAKNIADNMDVGIGIGITDDENIYNIDFTKTRDFRGKGFTIEADRSRMTFISTGLDIKEKNFKEERIGGKVKT
jgi:replicative DNA helicase